ncbi:hypothetical protein ACPXCX_46275, partial [Streptomyces sp. DT225]
EVGAGESLLCDDAIGVATDALLRVGFELSDETLQAAGWEHVPDEETTSLYRITFPAHQQ